MGGWLGGWAAWMCALMGRRASSQGALAHTLAGHVPWHSRRKAGQESAAHLALPPLPPHHPAVEAGLQAEPRCAVAGVSRDPQPAHRADCPGRPAAHAGRPLCQGGGAASGRGGGQVGTSASHASGSLSCRLGVFVVEEGMSLNGLQCSTRLQVSSKPPVWHRAVSSPNPTPGARRAPRRRRPSLCAPTSSAC